MPKETPLTEELIDQICVARRARVSWEEIANLIGFTPRTLLKWRKRGKEEYESGKRSKRGRIYRLLHTRLMKVRAEQKIKFHKVVEEAATEIFTEITKKVIKDADGKTRIEQIQKNKRPDAKLAMRWLEVNYPDEFAPMQRTELANYQTALKDNDDSLDDLENEIEEDFSGSKDEDA